MKPARMLALLSTLAAAIPARAEGYPTPAVAGFHHCALIYDRPTRSADDLGYYVARSGSGRPDWLYDAFLFLIQGVNGIRTEYGETRKPEWVWHLDRWFAPGRDLASLDAALQAATSRLGAPPPTPRRVMLSIPYVNRNVTDFGDVDGDGVSENLATVAGRQKVLAWYMDTARQRFQSAGYQHLDLWGFYWMREDMETGDEAVIRAASDLTHARGLRLLWIPYHRASGWERWKQAGFDVAILQPNYAFTTWRLGGRSMRNRLTLTADLARTNGIGVEIEAYDLTGEASSRRVFRHYLAEGTLQGYQQAASCHYLATDLVESTARSTSPDVRRMYDILADYVAGRPVQDPDPRPSWTWTQNPDGGRVAEAEMEATSGVAVIEVLFTETSEAWRGAIQVEVRAPDQTEWTPGGWALKTAADPLNGRWQMVRVPVEQKARHLRVSFRPETGSPAQPPTRITWEASDAAVSRHDALFRPYTFSPSPPAQYPDSGNELTDGVIPPNGFASGGTVGWSGVSQVAVLLDLGSVKPVERVEVHAQGGGYAAVNFPSQTVALFGVESAPVAGFFGFGALPPDRPHARGGPVVIDRRRSSTDMDGHITLAPAAPIPARYVTVVMEATGWLMLSEVKVFSDGQNVAPLGTYALQPPPTGTDTYSDDGIRLTDGVVAKEWIAAQVTGWQSAQPRTAVVDLGSVRPVNQVTVWSLFGGQHGIFAPKQVAVDVSPDGASWTELGLAGGPSGSENETGKVAIAAPYRRQARPDTTARYVRVRVTGGTGWTMLSEIEVR